jgi:hypothetical protein
MCIFDQLCGQAAVRAATSLQLELQLAAVRGSDTLSSLSSLLSAGRPKALLPPHPGKYPVASLRRLHSVNFRGDHRWRSSGTMESLLELPITCQNLLRFTVWRVLCRTARRTSRSSRADRASLHPCMECHELNVDTLKVCSTRIPQSHGCVA